MLLNYRGSDAHREFGWIEYEIARLIIRDILPAEIHEHLNIALTDNLLNASNCFRYPVRREMHSAENFDAWMVGGAHAFVVQMNFLE